MKILFLKTVQVLAVIIGVLSIALAFAFPAALLELTLPMVIIVYVTEKAIKSAQEGEPVSNGMRSLYSAGAILGGLVCGFGVIGLGSLSTLDTGQHSSGSILFIVIGIAVAVGVTAALLAIVNNISPDNSPPLQPYSPVSNDDIAAKVVTSDSVIENGNKKASS